jgi:putative ABC transport system permease protein
MYPEYRLPEEQRQAWFRTRTGAIAGRKTAEKYGWKVGDRIPLQATVWRKKDGSGLWEFDLVGIYDGGEAGTDTTNFFFRYDYFDEARQFGDGLVGFYLVRVDDARRAVGVAAAIDREFENSSMETKAETEGAFLQGWARQIGDITTIVTSIMLMAFFTILLVAGNTMAQSVRERTEELGALKAMGFTNLRVLGLVLGEACFLAALGGGMGLMLASMSIAGGDPTGGLLPMFRFPRQDVLTGVGWILVLGVLSGIFPALQAMRLQIAEALRRN